MPGTAVCLVGELRSLIFPVVQQRLEEKLLHPLSADAFLIGARRWSRPASVPVLRFKGRVRRPVWHGVPESVSAANVSRILSELPRIRSSLIAEDEEVLSMASTGAGLEGRGVSLRERCPGADGVRNHTNADRPTHAEWTRESCFTRLVHSIRLRLCLRLIEAAEAERRSVYRSVVRTRPDIWLPSCAMTPRSIGSRLDGAWVAAKWDYITAMPRAMASTSLRELFLAPAVGVCRQSASRELCNLCILQRHGAVLLRLHSDATVARHCQLIEDEKSNRLCSGFSGPPAVPRRPNASGAALQCHALDARMYLSLQFANKSLGCDDDGGGNLH